MSMREGDPIPCPCGGTMVVKFSEPVWSGDFHRKIKAGVRYMYVWIAAGGGATCGGSREIA